MKQSAEWNGFKRLLTMIGDVGLFNLSILLAFYWRFGSDIPEWNFKMYEGSAVYISLLFLLVNFFLGVYVYYNRRISDIIFNTVLAQTITILGLTMITFMGRWRVFIYYMYIHFTSNYKVAVLSYEHELPAVLENFHSAKNNKHKVTYVVSDHFVENAKKIIDKVDIFYLTKSLPDEQRREIIDIIIKKEKTILLPSTFDNLMMLRPNLMNFEDESVMGITQFRIKPESAILKRIFDIVVGLLMLVVASPFMLVTAILVKLSSPGPIIYKQTRITLNQKEFKILKFRTMSATAEAKSGPVLAKAHDSRITPVGKYLRKFRLDELPQIFNVLKGDMSIVGPRPERPYFVDQFNQQEPHYYLRHNVRAGITGYAQVYGKYASDYHSKLKFDLLYIKTYSIFLDARILLQTIKILFDKVSSQGLEEDTEPERQKLHDLVVQQDITHLS